MFSTLKLKARRKSPDRRKRDSPTRTHPTWSERAFCLGARGSGREARRRSLSREDLRPQRDPEPQQRQTRSVSRERPRHQDTFQEEGVVSRVVGLSLARDQYGLGINLRGGRCPDGTTKPLIVTYIKPGSPADRDGRLRVGDRLLAVNGRSLTGLSLGEVESAVLGPVAVLSVEYDVSLLGGLRSAGGPLLVDVEPGSARALGLSLIDSGNSIIVSGVAPASLAERCGALLPGDRILAVNQTRIDSSYKASNVLDMIRSASAGLLQLEILPVPSISTERMCPSPSSWLHQRYSGETQTSGPRSESPCPTFITHEQCQELKVECGMVTLHTAPEQGFGLRLRWVPAKMAAVVSDIEPDGVADRCGVLQIGDRVTSVNGCRPGAECGLGNATIVTLEVQFDVEIHPPVEPGTTVSLRLARSHASGFGITISGYSETGRSGVVVSGIRWGSVSHRCGRLSVGDHLLAIGEARLDGDIRLATAALQHCPNVVNFLVLKHPNSIDLGYSSSGLPSVDSTVQSWDDHGVTLYNSPDYDGRLLNLESSWKERASQSLHSLTTQQSLVSESDGCLVESKSLTKLPPSPPCPLQTSYNLRKDNATRHWRQSSSINNNDVFADLEALEAEFKMLLKSDSGPTFHTFRGDQKKDDRINSKYTYIRTVRLFKDPVYDDFGFSVSDGLFEKGVFINRIRPGGPADLSRCLSPYDRIIQVNETNTEDFDCCLTVPLVASSSEPLSLVVARQSVNNPQRDDEDGLTRFEIGVQAQVEPCKNQQQLPL